MASAPTGADGAPPSEFHADESPLLLTDELIEQLLDDRPLPPESLHAIGNEIEPSIETAEWLKRTFIDEGAPLFNPDHRHLMPADIVVLWTNREYVDGDMPVVGAAEIVRVTGKPWPQVEKTDHLCMLHGRIPELRMWLYAPFAAVCDFWEFCSVVEHELYHWAQKRDKEGMPVFIDDDKPVWTKRPHDVEEFVGCMRRYGPGACRGKSKEFVEAASRPPLVRPVQMQAVCGSCGRKI